MTKQGPREVIDYTIEWVICDHCGSMYRYGDDDNHRCPERGAAMKALTLTQPWATLVALGAKRIETRSWYTPYRGPLAIHAAKGLGPVGGERGLQALCVTSPFREALLGKQPLPCGAIVAVCRLISCCLTQTLHEDLVRIAPHELEFGDYTPGRFAWVLSDIVALPDPIPARGALGLWDWTPTSEERGAA